MLLSADQKILKQYESDAPIHLENLADMEKAFTYPNANAAFIQSKKDYLTKAMEDISKANAILARLKKEDPAYNPGYFETINDAILTHLDKEVMDTGLKALGIQNPLRAISEAEPAIPLNVSPPKLDLTKTLQNPWVRGVGVATAATVLGNLGIRNVLRVFGDYLPLALLGLGTYYIVTRNPKAAPAPAEGEARREEEAFLGIDDPASPEEGLIPVHEQKEPAPIAEPNILGAAAREHDAIVELLNELIARS